MKTIIFLLLLSLSFAFSPESLYNRDNLKMTADVMAGSALESLEDVKSSDSSDYLVIEIYPDESDWSSIASEIIQLFKPIFMNFTEAYSDYLSANNVSLEDQLLYDDILTSISQLFNETIEEKALYGNTTGKNSILGTDKSEDQVENDSAEMDWSSIASEIIELFKPIFMNFTEIYPEYRSNNNDVNLEHDILMSIARFVNETAEERGLSGDAINKDDILETDKSEDQSDSDYLIIKIDSDVSDWSNIESEIIQQFKPIFKNFTEAYSDYLSVNNVSLEDQLLYDNILTSIAQLLNETIEEEALFVDTVGKYNIIETDKSEDGDENDSAASDLSSIALEIIELFKPILVNFTEIYPEYRSNNNDINLEQDILMSIARFVNETAEERGLSGDAIEKDDILETNNSEGQSDSDYLIIEIDSDVSDWSNIESEIIDKPIFMNFTEAYSGYLSTNDVSLEDQLLYDDILTSIAQLFNETIEEKALYGDITEKDNIAGTDNREERDENNFLRFITQ